MEDQALQLKDAGNNKAFREGRWSDALMSYFDGLKVLNEQATHSDPLEAIISSAAEASSGRPALTSGTRSSPIGIAIRSNISMVSLKGSTTFNQRDDPPDNRQFRSTNWEGTPFPAVAN